MTKAMIIQNGIILFYIIQRISELIISQDNEKWLKQHCQAVEVNPNESLGMKVFHTLWFISLLLETNIKREFQPDHFSLGIYLILGICLAVRLHTMEKLKQFWTVKVFAMNNQIITTSGLYRYLRHPNYLVVILEFIFLPLLFKAYFTMGIFSILNIFVLKRRIKLEESTLMSQSNYLELFTNKKRLMPFMFLMSFFLNFSSGATENIYRFNNYKEAHQSASYVKFESTSTKLGFITTTFDGYAKEININYTLENGVLSKLETNIPVKSLDTDLESRDEKMHQQIMEADKYPSISVTLPEKVTLNEGEQTINMVFTIKDKKIVRPVNFSVKKAGGKTVISGSSSLGLKEIGLPDPSIAIAKVRDLFDLKFSIEL